jgi:nitrogen fixation protein FixH
MIARTAGSRSVWRFFPLAVIAWLGFVALVNTAMSISALRTFPGTASTSAFDTSNDYNAVLDVAARQNALGWDLQVIQEQGRVVVRLDDRTGSPVGGLVLKAVASRPLGPEQATPLDFAFDGRRHVATQALPAAGQWDVVIIGTGGPVEYRATRRVTVQ